MRSNHWDTVPTLSTSVAFSANESTATLSLISRNDQGDLTDPKLPVSVVGVVAGDGTGAHGYGLGHRRSVSTRVTGNAAAPALRPRYEETFGLTFAMEGQ